MLPGFFDSVLELIVKTSTDLPPDVRAAMRGAMGAEQPGTQSAQALTIIAQNIDQAAVRRRGDLPGHRHADVRGARAARQPIRSGCASRFARPWRRRPGSESCGRIPSIRSREKTPATTSGRARRSFTSINGKSDDIEVKLLLKGGGCENMNTQYSLPTELPNLGRADRTLEGVRKCILHAVWNAQGKGCAPGAIGVCIGGDRTSGYLQAKEQLFRTLDDVNPDPRLAELEADDHGHRQHARHRHDGIRRQRQPDRLQDWRAQPAARELLRIGRVRLLGVPPARRAARRARRLHHAVAVSRSEQPGDSDDRSGRICADADARSVSPRRSTKQTVRSLKVGDVVLVSGRMYTGRDAVHAHLMKHEPPVDLERLRPLSLRSRRQERRRRMDGDGGRSDDEHPRGALSGRDPSPLRRARGRREGRHGREDAAGPQRVGRGLPECGRRRGAVLRTLHRADR